MFKTRTQTHTNSISYGYNKHVFILEITNKSLEQQQPERAS